MSTPSDTPLVRAALALYPPAWRARYCDEVRALLDESGGGPRAIASIAWRAVPAWIRPPEHLFDRPARMRSSLVTVLVAAAMLTGLGLVFAQLTQAQGYRPPGHPIVGWSYIVFDAALAVSALTAAAGGLPLWLLMLRSALRERRRRDLAYLLLPAIASAAYLATLRVVVGLVGGPDGVGPGWFLAVTLAGFAAAAVAAAGPVWPCAGCSHAARPCAWPRSRQAWPLRPCSWPPWPAPSPRSAWSSGRRASPPTTSTSCPASTWPWSRPPRRSPR